MPIGDLLAVTQSDRRLPQPVAVGVGQRDAVGDVVGRDRGEFRFVGKRAQDVVRVEGAPFAGTVMRGLIGEQAREVKADSGENIFDQTPAKA